MTTSPTPTHPSSSSSSCTSLRNALEDYISAEASRVLDWAVQHTPPQHTDPYPARPPCHGAPSLLHPTLNIQHTLQPKRYYTEQQRQAAAPTATTWRSIGLAVAATLAPSEARLQWSNEGRDAGYTGGAASVQACWGPPCGQSTSSASQPPTRTTTLRGTWSSPPQSRVELRHEFGSSFVHGFVDRAVYVVTHGTEFPVSGDVRLRGSGSLIVTRDNQNILAGVTAVSSVGAVAVYADVLRRCTAAMMYQVGERLYVATRLRINVITKHETMLEGGVAYYPRADDLARIHASYARGALCLGVSRRCHIQQQTTSSPNETDSATLCRRVMGSAAAFVGRHMTTCDLSLGIVWVPPYSAVGGILATPGAGQADTDGMTAAAVPRGVWPRVFLSIVSTGS
eukprot:PhM_4_TR9496/c0_g1_i2/m.25934